ncbi:MAG: glycosyltransferase [Moorea sp. SIO2B7]|nr:glycosyltransferase [Moorena sp. SIO2B7]
MSNSSEDSSTSQEFLPKVSVIVPIYNGELDLPELIDCLRAQTYPATQVEYLLVDNNSSDRTTTILQSAAEEASREGLTILPLSENQIQSSYAARNTGIREANNDIMAFTDADCRPQTDWLEKLVQPFVNSNLGIVVGEIVGLPGKTILEKFANRYSVLSQKFTLEHPFFAYGQTANLAIRRQAFVEVGLFRPYLTTGGDADICWRILGNTDLKIEFAPNAIIRHRHRSNLRELRSQWQRYGRSNRYLHELYGVDLMRELTTKEAVYRLGRWLFKEIPINAIKVMRGKGSPLDIIKTPIDLLGFQARSLGQRESKLPDLARKIDQL